MILMIKHKMYWKIITFFKYAIAIITMKNDNKKLDAFYSIELKFVFLCSFVVIYVMSNILNFADIQRKQSSLSSVNKVHVKICICIWPWRQFSFLSS